MWQEYERGNTSNRTNAIVFSIFKSHSSLPSSLAWLSPIINSSLFFSSPHSSLRTSGPFNYLFLSIPSTISFSWGLNKIHIHHNKATTWLFILFRTTVIPMPLSHCLYFSNCKYTSTFSFSRLRLVNITSKSPYYQIISNYNTYVKINIISSTYLPMEWWRQI